MHTPTATADFALKSFTFSRIAAATDLSSISLKPEPSTSQTPACAMFHKPDFADPTNPRAKNSGTTTARRSILGAWVNVCVATSVAVSAQATKPTFILLCLSFASMFVSVRAASARRVAASSSLTRSFSSTSR